MRKVKEFALLLGLFIVSVTLHFVVCFPSPFVAGSDNGLVDGLVDGIRYFGLLLSDKMFLPMVVNTFRKPFVSSVVLISWSVLILKNKLSFTRKSFYLTAFAASFIISIVYLITITNTVPYNLWVYIFFPLSISFLCLIVLWILELIADIVKKFRRNKEAK